MVMLSSPLGPTAEDPILEYNSGDIRHDDGHTRGQQQCGAGWDGCLG